MVINKLIGVLLVAFVIAQPVVALGSSSARLIPENTVSLLSGDKEVSSFKSQIPLPEGQMLQCKGNCLVQAQSVQLLAHDGTVFSVSETEKTWEVTLQRGSVDFRSNPQAKNFVFRTGNETAMVQKVVYPSDGGLLRGTASVTDKGLKIAVTQGELTIASNKGEQTISAGQAAVVTGAGVATAAATAGTAAAGTGVAAAGSTGLGTTAAVVGAAGAAGIGAMVGLSQQSNNDPITPTKKHVSPY